ncbi:MAG: MYG1 family protein [Candidatus Caenarcaniphilales bacterium]|nr:MYG1 family protein [Candidatus Caenarcaniphilales bacterium]
MSQVLKILTHSGTFHADEVFACALLKIIYKDIEVTRSRDKELIDYAHNDSEIVVIDVGEKFEAPKNNFDHHQDMALPASAGLVWNEYKNKWITDQRITNKIYENLIRGIDAIDKNTDNILKEIEDLTYCIRTISQVIGGFNRDPNDHELQQKQFFKAIEVAIEVLLNEKYKAEGQFRSEMIWKQGEFHKSFAIFSEYCSVWKERSRKYADDFGNPLIRFAVMPNPQGWQILSIDSKRYPLPEKINNKDLVFAHKARFIAIFKTKDSAVSFARSICMS